MKKFKSFVSAVAFCVVPGVFGMHGEGKVSGNDIVKRASRLLGNIQTIDESIKRNKNARMVVLLGATGSGKTSLLHALAGARVNAVEDSADLNGRLVLVPSADATDEIGEVSGRGRSVTSGIRPFQIGDVIYCDGPGFFDTGGGFTEMHNVLSMNKILKKGTKVLWVVSTDELSAMRGGAAAEVVEYLRSLLPVERTEEAERNAMNIGIVISKGREARSAEDASGMLRNAFNMLRDRDNYHWLIDYLAEHAADNAFWFPLPTTGGEYHAPNRLVSGIRDFAMRRAGKLITGSMELRPGVITYLQRNHEYFDVRDEVDKIVQGILLEFNACKDDLDKLKELREETFNALWTSLAKRVSGSDNPEDSVRWWRRRKSFGITSPKDKFNFALKDFVDVLNSVERFKIICNVEYDGFTPWFERGIVWEGLVDYISKLSNTSEDRINELRRTGYRWRTKLPGLVAKDWGISGAIRKAQQTKGERTGASVGSAVFAVGGGIIGGLASGGIGAVPAVTIGASTGAAVGASVGAGITKVIHVIQNNRDNQEDGDLPKE